MQASSTVLQNSAVIDIPPEGVDGAPATIDTIDDRWSRTKTLRDLSLSQASADDDLTFKHTSRKTKELQAIAASVKVMANNEEKWAAELRCSSMGCSGHGKCDAATGQCACEEHWTGAMCDTSACPDNCYENGLCMFGECLCGPQFFGDNCEHERCPQDCAGNGYCFMGKCMCNDGFGGSNCLLQTGSSKVVRSKLESSKTSANSSTLAPAATSQLQLGEVQEISAASASSAVGESWQRKEGSSVRTCLNKCNWRGKCVEGSCVCHDGYQGSDCSIQTICNGNGRLTESLLETGERLMTCVCDEGFGGRDCERQLVCAHATCSGNGVCQHGSCACNAGFSGHSCQISTASVNTAAMNSSKAGTLLGKKAINPITSSWMKNAKLISAVSVPPKAVELQIHSTAGTIDAADKAGGADAEIWHPALIPKALPAMPGHRQGAGSLLAFLRKGNPQRAAEATEWKEASANESASLDSLLSGI
jgi:hypothetical protein